MRDSILETRIRYTYALEEAVFNYRSDGIDSLTNYYLNLKTRSNPCQGIANYNYTSYSRSKHRGYEEYFKVDNRYDTVNGDVQNYTRFVYTNHDVKNKNYTTKIEYRGVMQRQVLRRRKQ